MKRKRHDITGTGITGTGITDERIADTEMSPIDQSGNRVLTMAAVFIATFMTSVEVTIVTTALPSIISSLHGLEYQSWIMSAYMLTTAIATPVFGKLADTVGRRGIFLWGVVIFTVGTLLSGLAPHILLLVLARAIQGIGAGSVMPLTFTIIADLYDYSRRANVLALNNTAWGLSALVGPLIGGFLVDRLSWHWVFFINVPLGVIVTLLILLGYREPTRASRNGHLSLDAPGILWLGTALVALLLGIQMLVRRPFVAVPLIVAAILSSVMLHRRERSADDPLIAPEMFRNPTFGIQILTTTLLSGVLISYQSYFPIWLQSLYRVDSIQAGLVVTSSSVMWLAASLLVGRIIARMVPRTVTLWLTGSLTVTYLTLTIASPHFPIWAFYVIAMLNGTVMGIVISMNTVLSQHLVPKRYVGSATSILTLGRSLGQTVMTGSYGTALTLIIRANLHGIPFSVANETISSGTATAHDPVVDSAILNGSHGVFSIVVVIMLVMMVLNLRDPNRSVVR
ncbi:MFS superfamily multidrug resistance transporter [Bifidobacterium minimum]|uniref:MFS superfamily multidrug resistance transporter n=1 Tax=Bifidobacterium minimum TaxID=1693 RepID=A0A087BPL8_9BIFI|nr:MFS transporter [Bifidobacterium minimum]KFI72968.1 MFS superfamily multidrug resistance transporter [Bifidobacterium minimum]